MDGKSHGIVTGLKHHFVDLEDPRITASCDHLLIGILAITTLAVFCGSNDWTNLETVGRLRYD
jgi:hypothetical protein